MTHHCSICGKKTSYHDDHHYHDFHHVHHGFEPHHHHHQDYCRHHDFEHHGHDHLYDRFLCDKDFRVRLGGLQGGLNYRLRQLIGCVVKMELEGDRKVKARICFVGSDFVEIEVLDHDKKEEEKQEENKDKKKKKKKKKKHKKIGKSWILPFESVGFVELDDHH
ncbi:hypothetical protein JOC85_000487 [Bacillus mesophilus]|uniref:C2H2-type domain-containing protein n=1 Tax=Bacillus mesophilus TaxID=1808955 RepID=A0A6M0Q360_9BACI|nr:hypothetical protein [Bacillus mesophilus]MBM7659720.1 hypothetical protein [Bacillus mesophilus]NEY70583.1 hypothetical protein [Bacillus mesophilus]